MRSWQRAIFVTLILLTGFGCASTSSKQDRDLAKWEEEGLLVKEKDPSTAAWLGILPGVGSFYTGQIGLGIVDVLLWPISVCWDPVAGYGGAKLRNWRATSAHVDRLERNRNLAYEQLEDMHGAKEISESDYRRVKRQIAGTPLREFDRGFDLNAKIRTRTASKKSKRSVASEKK